MNERYEAQGKLFDGCDRIVRLPESRVGTDIRLLQLTDMQFIDAAERRTPDALYRDETVAWDTECFMPQCGDHVLSLVAQARPDLIFITGDLIYGRFDDSGRTLDRLCRLMDSFAIPWAPVFGNHDNESALGVEAQCERLQASEYCLFSRGEVSGNGNYTVGIAVGDELVRVIHLADSNGCKRTEDAGVIKEKRIFPDQLALIEGKSERICRATGRSVPAFMAFHIPTAIFAEALREKGYETDGRKFFTVGVDVPSLDGDFGFCYESISPAEAEGDLLGFLKRNRVDGVFVGHCHKICTSVLYKGVRLTFGLKTGQYDYHLPGSLGGTLVTLRGEDFEVRHLPALVPLAPMSREAGTYDGIFVDL